MTVMYQRTLANFKDMLKKRCNRHNINFVEIDEAYTSVCSFVDNESIKAKKEYCGKRVTRDKYYSKQGYSIHADVNASYNIAKKYQILWQDLMKVNNLKDTTISIGKQLIVPGNADNIQYSVEKGDTLDSIAKKFNTTIDNIKEKNNLINDDIITGQILKIK